MRLLHKIKYESIKIAVFKVVWSSICFFITLRKLFSIYIFLLENNCSSGTDYCFYRKIIAFWITDLNRDNYIFIFKLYTRTGIITWICDNYIPHRVYFNIINILLCRNGLIMSPAINSIVVYLKNRRKLLKLTQHQLAIKAGVGLRFIRDLEQGKTTLRMDKVNQVLKLFGQELGPIPIDRNKLIRDWLLSVF